MKMDSSEYKEHSITVSGTASDMISSHPIQDIRLTMLALEKSEGEDVLSTTSAFTDEEGRFIIRMTGFKSPTSFSIKAEDPSGVYKICIYEIPLVKWDSSYSISQGTIYINGCDFHMKRED